MINLKGGTRLRFADHIGISPLYNMLKSRSAILELITDASAFSYIFKLTVTENNSEYLNSDILNSSLCKPIDTAPVLAFNASEKEALTNAMRDTMDMDMDEDMDEDTDKIMTPITKYILKIVVLGNDRYRYGNKSTDTPENFFGEVNLQEDIWRYSIRGGRLPLCPSVANIWNFDNTNSSKFIKCLIDTFGGWRSQLSSQGKTALLFIQQLICSNEHLNIGVSLMPEIPNSYTLYRFEKIYTQAAVSTIALKSIALFMRLFIETGIIQKDFHRDNILVYPCGNSFEVILIDFGVIEDIRQMNLYGLDQQATHFYKEYWEHCRQQFEALTNTNSNRMATRGRPTRFNTVLLNEMFDEFNKYIIQQRVSLDHLQWIDYYFIPSNYMQIFEYLKNYMSANIQAGDVVDSSLRVERPIYSMNYVEFPGDDGGWCAVMGGRKSKKRTRKYNKHKKQLKDKKRI